VTTMPGPWLARVARTLGVPLLLAASCAPPPDRASRAAWEEVVSPSFDCGAARSSAQELVCEDTELARLDLRLDSVFALALARAGSMADAARALPELRAHQRGWVKGRDDCWKAGDLRTCVREAYRRRAAELEAQYMLLEGRPPVFWFCDNDPTNEFVTSFYETDPPSARIERGDRTVVALLTPSASGSRYEGPFGIVFWTRGDEAQVDWPQGTSLSCVVR